MTPTVVPPRLRTGDLLRVVAPACSRAFVTQHDHTALTEARFTAMGLRLSYGEHVDERDDFDSSSVASRVADLHAAFADPEVAGVITAIGGYNSNELLPHLDWELIAAHPKVFCGFSDITALQNAVLARTGLVTYSGPHWCSFGMRDHLEPTQRWFVETLFDDAPIDVRPADAWTDDAWFLDQDDRTLEPGSGWWALRPGRAGGRLVGGNLCTLNLLQGTPWMPGLDGAVLAVEDDLLSTPETFARDLTSLLQLPDAAGVRGLLVGRFQKESRMTRGLLQQIVDRQPLADGCPVLADVDFGHTSPLLTLPIGGDVEVSVEAGGPSTLRITRH